MNSAKHFKTTVAGLLAVLITTFSSMPVFGADAVPKTSTGKSVIVTEMPNKRFMGTKPALAAIPQEDTAELISLFVGEAKTLPVNAVTRVAVGNGKLITANVIDGHEILLLGEAPGDTSLFIWSAGQVQKYRVKIDASDINNLTNNIQAMVKDLPNVKIDHIGNQVVLSGTVSKVDLKRVETIAGSSPQVVNLVREEEVTMKKMVYIKVQFMEFRKNALENLGIDWATNINGPGAAVTADVISNRQFRYAPATTDPTFNVGAGANQPLSIASQPWRAYLGLATSISSRINLAITNGDAGVLAAPELATRSGGEAKFLAGGQVPLPVVSSTGQSSVTFKDYGIRLNMTPIVDDNNMIQAKLETEVSSVDFSVSVTGIPGFITRSSSSDINLKSGQTIVMSGLVNQTMSNSINKFPWLGDVPILGVFFKSRNFNAGRTDLVMFVTPTVIDPASTTNQQRLDKAKQMREKFDGIVGNKGIVD
ncbi:MAG: type II and III secretion system protein family protein [Methylophilaceae bacterium]